MIDMIEIADKELISQLEDREYRKICEIMEDIVFSRYTKKDLTLFLREELKDNSIKIEDTTYYDDDVYTDYNLIFEYVGNYINLDIDIYYAKCRNKMLYITEVAINHQ